MGPHSWQCFMTGILTTTHLNDNRDNLWFNSFVFFWHLTCETKKRFHSWKKLYDLMCVSFPSANEFSAILFLLFARSSSNYHRSFQRFRQTLRRNFKWIRQQMKNFPIDPHCKNACFRQRYNVAESGQFYNRGLWRNSLPIFRFKCLAPEFV